MGNIVKWGKIRVMKKFLSWLVLIIFSLFIGALLLGIISFSVKSIENNYAASSLLPAAAQKGKTIKLILTGDIMLDRGVEYMIEKYGNGDFKFPFLKIADYLKQFDVVFGNLEGPISDKGEKVGSIYSFRNDPQSIDGLTYAGFNVISLANNHAFDYGREALEDCLAKLNNAGINYVGAGFNASEIGTPIIKEIKGTKIGFLAYTNLGPETWKAIGENSGIAWIDEKLLLLNSVKQDIEKAKSKSDILIVSLHSGEEYQKTPTQFQIDFSKMAIEAGADLLVGHHPHVVQPNETYNGGHIFYSLGNFVFDQGFSEETMQGEMVKVIIEDGKIGKITPMNVDINSFFQPEIK